MGSAARPHPEAADPVIAELIRQAAALRRLAVRVVLGEQVATQAAEAMRRKALARGLNVGTVVEADDGP